MSNNLIAVEVYEKWQYAAKIERIGSFDQVELSLNPPNDIRPPKYFEVSMHDDGMWELMSSKPISNSIYCIYTYWRRRVTMKQNGEE